MHSPVTFANFTKSKKSASDLDFLAGLKVRERSGQPISKPRGQVLNEKLDELESKMMGKAEVQSGFASIHGKVRHLSHVFKFYDQNNYGYINYPDFLDVLNKFNLSGYQREGEELFNRYDEDMLGHIDHKELSMRLHGVAPFRGLSPTANNALYAIRAGLCGKHEFLAFRYYRAVMRLPSLDAAGFVSLEDMLDQIYPRTSKFLAQKPFVLLLSELETNGDSRVSAYEFLKILKRDMDLFRKRLVRAVFDKLDAEGRGYVTENEVRANYRGSASAVLPAIGLPGSPAPSSPGPSASSPSVFDMSETGKERLDDVGVLVRYMRATDELSRSATPEGTITWHAFLDYYRWISLSLEDERDFEGFLRASWVMPLSPKPKSLSPSPSSVAEEDLTLSSGVEFLMSRARATSPITLKVTVTRTNGREEEVEVRDDLSTLRYSLPSLHKSVARKGIQDIAKLSW